MMTNSFESKRTHQPECCNNSCKLDLGENFLNVFEHLVGRLRSVDFSD